MNTGELLPEPSVNEKADIALLHLEKSLEFKEGNRAIYEMRRHLSNYFKGLPHFKETRLKLLTAVEVEEIKFIISEIRKNGEISEPMTGLQFTGSDIYRFFTHP